MSQLEHVKFQHVFRDGDRNATSVGHLVVHHSTVRGFKAGSERARQIPNCWPPCRGEKRRTFNCRVSEDDLIEARALGRILFQVFRNTAVIRAPKLSTPVQRDYL